MDKIPLEVSCIYRSKEGREVYFASILDNTDYIEIDNINDFWNAMGGISITINNHCLILRETNFYVLLKPITFLLNNIFWLNNWQSNWFNEDDEYPGCVTIRTLNNNRLVISLHDELNIAISYYNEKNNIDSRRNNHFFESVIVNKADWENALLIALKEYFEIYKRLLFSFEPFSQIETNRLEFYKLWEKIEFHH